MQKATLLVLVILVICGQSIAAQKPYFDEHLARRSDEYFSAVESHRYDLIWDLSAASVHQDFGNDFNEFEQHLTSAPPVLVEYKTLKVLANGYHGWVWVRMSTVSQTDGTRESDDYVSAWILKEGEWFLESIVDGDYDSDETGEPVPRKVAQQARATERAHPRLTDSSTAVARAR